MTYAMSRAEREEFLAGVHVGVLATVERGRPLAVPVWYAYQPGGVVSVVTERDSRKALAVRASGWLSLCAQDESWPYKYVTVSGAAVIEEVELDERLALARRYLGADGGDRYVAQFPDTENKEIVIRMTPRHWLTVDYARL